MGQFARMEISSRFIKKFNDVLSGRFGVSVGDTLVVQNIGIGMSDNECVRGYFEFRNERTGCTAEVDVGPIIFDPDFDEVEDIVERLVDLDVDRDLVREKLSGVILT